MKIIHCADIHLGSKIEAKLPKDKSDERRIEVRSAFNKMLEYAKRVQAKVVMLSGDVFDSDRPLKKDKEFFYSAVKNNPDIDFLYLRGNHDNEESYTELDLSNLKTFSSEWQSYEYENVVISGVEILASNAASIYSTLELDASKINIVMLHGQIGDAVGVDKVNLQKLNGKNIAYLALGHLHSFSDGKLDSGNFVYSGCLEGRGFDEIGEKGFVEINVDDKLEYSFVKNSIRVIEEVVLNISEATDLYEAVNLVQSRLKSQPKNILRLIVNGEISFDNDGLSKELEKMLSSNYYFVSVKDKTSRKFDIAELEGDLSLRGEFIRSVLKKQGLSDEEKQQIVSYGLKAIVGREIE